MKNFLNKVFKIDENQTTIKAEIIGGITTFFAMCYIVIVNPNSLSGGVSEIWNASFVGGLLAAVVATLCMAFIANKPFALAAGMGLNSFFFVSFILPCFTSGANPLDGYGAGLAVILISGILFLILSVTGLRKYIATSLPSCLKCAIPAGIGLFIAFIGFKNAGIVIPNQYTFVQIADFTKWSYELTSSVGGAPASTYLVGAAPALAAFIGLIAIVCLSKVKIKFISSASIILGVLVSTALFYAFGLFNPESIVTTSLSQVFSDFGQHGFFNLKFDVAFDGTTIGSIFSVIMLVITFTLVDMFDTIGTLYGASAEADMLDENGDPIGLSQEMLCDSIGTVVGAVTGTSTITTYVESSSGIAAGARTGLASVITAVLFIVCLFLAPLAQYIPTVATAPALIFVGILMSKNILKVDFSDLSNSAPAFLAFIIMPLTYSISNGIMVGAIAYTLIRLCTGKFTKKDIIISVIALISVLRFIFVVM